MMSEKQIKERIYQLKEEIRILESIVKTDNDGTMGRPRGSIKYNKEQIMFLTDNRDTPMSELVELFNRKFGTKLHPETRALYNFMCRMQIITAKARPKYNHSKDSPPIS